MLTPNQNVNSTILAKLKIVINVIIGKKDVINVKLDTFQKIINNNAHNQIYLKIKK